MSNLFSSKTDTIRKLRSFIKTREAGDKFVGIFESGDPSVFIQKISEFSKVVDCTDYEFGKPLQDCQNKIKGDIFEMFCLLWMETFGGDRAIFSFGIDWAPRDQKGIDFFAKNKFGHTLPIQTKFVANGDSNFESNRLETFFQESRKYTVPVEGAPSVILFTSAAKISSRYTSDKTMLIIDRKMISKFASKENSGFWSYLTETAKKLL
jgi:hypothetical protein